MAERIRYRLFQEDDLPGVLRLWEQESGWGGITPEQWRKWYIDTPYGPCLVVVAVDEQAMIAGQMISTPSCVVIDGREHLAVRLSAPILRHDIRNASIRSMNHPMFGMYLAGVIAAAARGYSLVYGLPDHAWIRLLRWLPRFDEAEFPCRAVPIGQAPAARSSERALVAQLAGDFGPEYDALWRTARAALPINCGVVRNTAWLRYKNGGHITLAIRDPGDNSLIGYSAINRRTGMLADILARSPDDLAAVLAATIDGLATHGGVDKLIAMETPILQPALETTGFVPIDYRFAFVCDPLTPDLSPDMIAPARWYVTAGD